MQSFFRNPISLTVAAGDGRNKNPNRSNETTDAYVSSTAESRTNVELEKFKNETTDWYLNSTEEFCSSAENKCRVRQVQQGQ